MMKNKKYQLAAWTRSSENGLEIRMIPSLHHEMQESYIKEIARCHKMKEEGHDVSERLMRAFEKNADFLFLTGHYGDGLRYIRKAALYCLDSDDSAWYCWDTDLGSYMYFLGRLRDDFLRLCRKFIGLAGKYGRSDIFIEPESVHLLEIYNEQTQEDRDLRTHLRKMKVWK